jgi:hypothetical protein
VRTCPFCTDPISPDVIACRMDWLRLSESQKQRLTAAHHAHRHGEIDDERLRAEVGQVVEAVNEKLRVRRK